MTKTIPLVKYRFLSIMLPILLGIAAYGQDEYFQGRIVYRLKSLSSEGKELPSAIDLTEIFFDKNHLLVRTTEGYSKRIVGNQDIYLDNIKNIAYIINHDRQSIDNVKNPKLKDLVQPGSKHIGVSEVKGYSCDVFVFKYIHRYEFYTGERVDTVSCTYYISKGLKLNLPLTFAQLQSNNNTILIDGRFDGIPLRIIWEHLDKSRLVVEAISIEKMNVNEQMKLPNYPMKD